MINWQNIKSKVLVIAIIIVAVALIVGNVIQFIQNKRLESKVKDQRALYVLEKEKRIEANEIAFDSINELNKEINRLIADKETDISDTNDKREQNKQDYEEAVNNADTMSRDNLQRKLSELFEGNR